MSLNWALALLSFGLWTTAYAGYFSRDLRGWWWRRQHRHELLAIRRAQGYAAYVRRTTPSRHRTWTPPTPPPRQRDEAVGAAPGAAARPSAEVIPFPAGRRVRLPPPAARQLNGE